MKNTLLALLTAGLLVFSGIDCVGTLSPMDVLPVASSSSEAREGVFIGQDIRQVIEILGEPAKIEECKMSLATGNGTIKVTGDSVLFQQGVEHEEHYIFFMTKLCAVFGTVVSQVSGVVNTVDGEDTATTWSRTDHNLLRRILQDKQRKDGREMKYIPKAGEMEL